MEEKTSFKDWALRAISVLGLIAILFIGVWGIIQITLAVPGFFAGFGKNTPSDTTAPTAGSSTVAQEQLILSLPTSITSGQPFTLSWKHQGGSGNYGYLISYSCATGLSLYAPTLSGTSTKVPCDTAFNFTSATETVQLTPTFTGAEQAAVTVSVSANKLSDSSIATKSTATTIVLPASSASTATKTVATKTPATKTTTLPTGRQVVPSTTYTATNKIPALSGLPNLVVYMTSAIPLDGRLTVQFTIANTGTNVAPAGWMFVALFPPNQANTYISGSQQALSPGDKIVYTLGFSIPEYNQTQTSPFVPPQYPNNNCGYAQSYTYNGAVNIPNASLYSCMIQTQQQLMLKQAQATNYYANQTHGHGAFVVSVDPQNFVQENNETDNMVGVPFN
ncbi:MAG: hypothetical protein Q7S26_01110 [bacterium]|nr:hypothetical protein [bacterium]